MSGILFRQHQKITPVQDMDTPPLFTIEPCGSWVVLEIIKQKMTCGNGVLVCKEDVFHLVDQCWQRYFLIFRTTNEKQWTSFKQFLLFTRKQ